MKTFRFHWLTGKVETGKGETVADAFTHLGHSTESIRVLDRFEEVKEEVKENAQTHPERR